VVPLLNTNIRKRTLLQLIQFSFFQNRGWEKGKYHLIRSRNLEGEIEPVLAGGLGGGGEQQFVYFFVSWRWELHMEQNKRGWGDCEIVLFAFLTFF